MRIHLHFLIALCLLSLKGLTAQELVSYAEAEGGTLSGVYLQTTDSGYSGEGYVTGFDQVSDYVEVTLEVAESGLYEPFIRYSAASGEKSQYVSVNGAASVAITFAQTNTGEWKEQSVGKYLLEQGVNTIRLTSYWGYMHVDRFLVYTTEKLVFEVDESPADPEANASARALYDLLKTYFGERMFSGQTDDYYDEVATLTGYYPVLRGFDLHSFTQGYPYNWADGDFAFGAVDNGQVDDAIAWHQATGGNGIVSFQWHWCSPFGGEAGTNTFYTDLTTFDVRQAVIPGTAENEAILQDIDAVAVQLKKLQEAGVPVFWRPLHEAGGGWFWWGAHGSEPCLALFDILYDRLQSHHGLHNLIWVWSTPETDWYPGNDQIDLIGYDSYPGAYNYTVQNAWFGQLHEVSEGKKMISMTENGPIPDVEAAFLSDAYWGLFMSWSNLVLEQNSTEHIRESYAHWRVLVLDEEYQLIIREEEEKVLSAGAKSQVAHVFPNPVNEVLHLQVQNPVRLILYDLQGKKVLDDWNPAQELEMDQVPSGNYLLIIKDLQQVHRWHLVVRH